MTTLRFDPEFEAATKEIREGPAVPAFTTALEVREFNDKFLPAITDATPAVDDIQQEKFRIQSYDGANIEVTRFASATAVNSPTPLPAMLFIHGGAMVAGSVTTYAPQVAYLASQTGFPFFAVEYRVAPEHPAPAGIEDSFAALQWLSGNSADLNVDASKLGVMGDSAGGLISASTALVARDRQLSPPLAKQILIYPALDDRATIAEDDPMRNFIMWRPTDTELVWKAYLGEDKAGKDDVEIPRNAVPGRVENLKGLPSTYIEIGSLDAFLYEDLTYAKRLAQAGVEVEMHIWPGLTHGWEMASGISWFKIAIERRVSAIKRMM